MVELFGVAVFVFVFPWSLWFGYRTVTAATLYRSLQGDASDSSGGLVAGETVAIEGTVDVDEPPDTAERAVDGVDSPIAAYVWRARFPRTGANAIDFENRELKQGKSTFASGIEPGTFTVADSGQEIRVDPEWLVERHEATELSELSVGGVNSSRSFHTYLWDSPYVHLTGDATEIPLDRMPAVVAKHDSSVDLDDYYLQSKAIRDGDTLAVRGTVVIDRGEPTIRGTGETPLGISDRGFEGLGADLRTRTIRSGFSSVALLAVAVFALLL